MAGGRYRSCEGPSTDAGGCKARKISWEFHDDEYVAVVGQPLRWRPFGSAGGWHQGLKVLDIDPGPP
jgi:hypothetical protein